MSKVSETTSISATKQFTNTHLGKCDSEHLRCSHYLKVLNQKPEWYCLDKASEWKVYFEIMLMYV